MPKKTPEEQAVIFAAINYVHSLNGEGPNVDDDLLSSYSDLMCAVSVYDRELERKNQDLTKKVKCGRCKTKTASFKYLNGMPYCHEQTVETITCFENAWIKGAARG